jgi:hypothetical protein
MFDVPMRGFAGSGPPLALVADGATEFGKRMSVMIGMIGQRQREARVAGIFYGNVTTGAAVHAFGFGQHDLPQFDRRTRRVGALFRCSGPCDFVFDVLPLPIFPLAMLVFVKGGNNQTTHHQAQEREPGIKFAKRRIHGWLLKIRRPKAEGRKKAEYRSPKSKPAVTGNKVFYMTANETKNTSE